MSHDPFFEHRSTTIARDLRLNLQKLLEGGQLTANEAFLALLATATATENAPLASHAREKLAALGVPAEQIQEAAESAAIMGMLNTYVGFALNGYLKLDDVLAHRAVHQFQHGIYS